MRVRKLLKSALILGAAASVFSIYSCGGGGGGGTEPTSTISITGNAVDGYIFGGTVFADCNNDKAISPSDPSGFTFGDPVADNDYHIIELDGNPLTVENYALEINNTCQGAKLYVIGGHDVNTQLPFGSVLIGIQGKYYDNITSVTSVIASSPDPTKTEKAIKTFFSIDNPGENYALDSTNATFFKFALAIGTSMQALSELVGQLDIETAEAIYKNIAEDLNARYDALNTTALTDKDIVDIISKAIVDGLSNVTEKNFNVSEPEIFNQSIKNILDNTLSKLNGDETSYKDLGAYMDNDSPIKQIHDTILASIPTVSGIDVGKINISMVKAVADSADNDNIAEDGSFDLEVNYTQNGQLDVIVYLQPENGNLIPEGTKPVNITLALKAEPRGDDKRSAIITFKDITITTDANGNVTSLDVSNAIMSVDGTDSTGNRAGLDRAITLTATDGILSLPTENEIKIDVAKLLQKISDAAPAGHPLENISLDGYTFRIGVTVVGLPTQPVTGNLTLH